MLSKINEAILRLFAREDEDGQALAEYGLILGLIAVVAIAALTLMGTLIAGELGNITDALGGGGS
jgi:pilus assembly protein Flp/PilA